MLVSYDYAERHQCQFCIYQEQHDEFSIHWALFFYYVKALVHSNTLALRYFTSVLHQSFISSWIQQTK